MKRILVALLVTVAVTIGATAILMAPRFLNMSSEYGTAQAIVDLKEYVQQHNGKWPGTPSDLGGRYPVSGDVHLDYSMTSARLIENPTLLRDAVRPRSGRFYTYPHYDRMIEELHAVLRRTNQNERVAPSSGDKSTN